MKNSKRIAALIAASVLSTEAVSSMSAGAAYLYDSSVEEFCGLQENGFKLSEGSIFDQHISPDYDYYVTVDEEGNPYLNYIDVVVPSYIEITIRNNGGIADKQKFENAINKLGASDSGIYSMSCKSNDENQTTSYKIYNSVQNIESKFKNELSFSPDVFETEEFKNTCLSEKQAKEIYSALADSELKDSLESVKYYNVGVHINTPLIMRPYDYYLGKEEQETLKSYIAENNLDYRCTIENPDADYSYMTITPNGDVSLEEHLKLADKIFADTGLYYWVNDIPLSSPYSNNDVIDMLNAVDGDANNDGELSLADAVSIMQAIGNPDEYALTPQGKFNADISGDNDGITNTDALAVQKKLLNLE